VAPEGPESVTTCPVCKTVLAQNRLIPVYCRGAAKPSSEEATGASSSPGARESGEGGASAGYPPRPKPPESPNPPLPPGGRRWQPPQYGGTGWQMSFGLGLFPFGGFGMYNFGDPLHRQQLSPQQLQRETLSKILMMVGFLVLFILFL
jgi:hypothetical protein